ncbi:Gfo/Idh/MocA family protein [Candidatus Laterigemmans baculatus]|uniref:Gfo/Idh/MocA family protein n=1 Tax=Candidatus Laterigemmans baculatus TaxID=2770505 RepID=UPI0013D9D4C2|nr:Gfo/Idh/MocA family oxidoreductase [Candidatus Laterigemmans baculatus]
MSTLNWGLIGCGDVARKRVAQAILAEPCSRLLAACRRDPGELAAFCRTFAVERAYEDAFELLVDRDIDVVYIATPVCEHLPQTLAAARAGKHVLVEKPMAMTAAECDQMIEACQEAGVKLSVAYYRRFYPLVHRMQQLIREGAIGKPMAVSAVTSTDAASDGWRWRLEQGGGGALMDVGSHRINIFTTLFGPPRSVKAICDRVVAEDGSEDTAVLLMQFTSGVVGTLQSHFRGSSDPDEFVVTGSRGRLLARPLNGTELIIESDAERKVEQHPPAANFNAPLIADFVSAITQDREPTVSGEEGRLTNQIIEAAYADAECWAQRP